MPTANPKHPVATSIKTRDNKTYVTYHNTDVVIHDHSRNTIILNSDGYRTATTKRRMNQYFDENKIPLIVQQLKHKWIVIQYFYDEVHGNLKNTLEFTDNMEIQL